MSFSENFINIMNAIGDKLGIAIDWTNQNVMPYLEQLCGRIVNYEISMCAFWIIVSSILLIVGVIIFIKGKKEYAHDEFCVFPMMIGGGIAIVALIAIGIYTTDIITAVTLPEKTIFEFIMQYK